MAYRSYAHPILRNGTTVLSPHLKSSVQLPEAVQNGFTRKFSTRIYSDDYTTTPSLLIAAKPAKCSILRLVGNEMICPWYLIWLISSIRCKILTQEVVKKRLFLQGQKHYPCFLLHSKGWLGVFKILRKHTLPNSLPQFKRFVDRHLQSN